MVEAEQFAEEAVDEMRRQKKMELERMRKEMEQEMLLSEGVSEYLRGCQFPAQNFRYSPPVYLASTRTNFTLKRSVLSISCWFCSTKSSARWPEKVLGFGPTRSCDGSLSR